MTLPSPVRPLAVAAAAVAWVVYAASACEVPDEAPSSTSAGDASPSELTMSSAEVCLDVGYLCAPLADSASFRILRWPDGHASVAVHVPIPAGVAPSDGRRLQAAAARGIEAWDGAPLRIDAYAAEASADIVVTWVPSLPDSRLGLARVEWAQRGAEVRFSVPRFELATHAPGAAPRLQTPAEVELVAVHEMGHALGLPHSDREADVMFPTRTARRLTTRDHRTAMALYGLPAGAQVVRE
ncbi:MAG TPA: matrixin family metalloprotease [Longimicrobiales bacterium]|nr:matrixin family metalloprotease [Longimicrobiales bacterium]